ncbi:MAG TPA: hypothetical protein DCF33_10595 [Saprospirales bacterium]|nr:hypothetical protein [Saprospirales bacterium]
MRQLLPAFFPLLLSSSFLQAQSGCPDPQALNYNASASVNDGSCLYPATSHSPTLQTKLNGDLQEISGLTQAGGRWWAHNDSGSDEKFFRVNPETGNLPQLIELKNAKNRDWEDIAAWNDTLYIGDFGNNSNNRQNLGVYMVPLSEIGNSGNETVQEFEWSFLPFSYIDQTDYSAQPEDSSVYDCEALVVRNGQVHLFTKSRKNYNTVHYRINPSNNAAEIVESFHSNGLITGASLSPDGKLIALVGYDLRPFIPTVFCWLLWDWPAGTDQFFAGNKRRIELGTALQVGQAESIGFNGNRTAYISNERTTFNGITLVDESIWNVDFSAWVPLTVGTRQPGNMTASWSVSPNPFTDHLDFQWTDKPAGIRLLNAQGVEILRLEEAPERLELGYLPAGVYYVVAGNEVWRVVKL